MSYASDLTDMNIVDGVWHLIAPNNQGEGAIEGGVSERAIFDSAWGQMTFIADPPSPSRTDIRELHERLVELVGKGRLIDHPGGGWRTPEPPEDAMYRLTMQGERHTYSFRGSQEHDAKATAHTLADLTGSREDYLRAVFIAPLKPGGLSKIGKSMDTLRFIVERTV